MFFSKVNLHDYLVFSKGRNRFAHDYNIWPELTCINFPIELDTLTRGITCQKI